MNQSVLGYIDISDDNPFTGIDKIIRTKSALLVMYPDTSYILRRETKNFDLTQDQVDIKDSYVYEINKVSIIAINAAKEAVNTDKLRLIYSYKQDRYDYCFVVSVIDMSNHLVMSP
jgi:hypothetical protein